MDMSEMMVVKTMVQPIWSLRWRFVRWVVMEMEVGDGKRVWGWRWVVLMSYVKGRGDGFWRSGGTACRGWRCVCLEAAAQGDDGEDKVGMRWGETE
ncbi:hypothetical protein MRB53_005839 [Persea americana]|uniref:Uncharacterized protein n=1 Tax=Persea americana TaxID=3435 RepID=A0ACC2MFC4_PERAE|nr:hypothetical protein MRB53_005839 [Persea americana]